MEPKPQILRIFAKNTRPYGMSYKEWTIRWWWWLLNIPIQRSPAYDFSGSNAHVGQNNSNVFFLCQTFEKQCKPFRTISIQKGMSLFFPLINWISTFPEDGVNDHELLFKAQSKMNSIGDLRVMINGNQVIHNYESYRVETEPFFVRLPKYNILRLSPGIKKAVSDGYWIFTESITKSIDLSTFGSCTAGKTKIAVNYHIKVN